MNTDKKLQLTFNTENNKTFSLYIDEPLEPIVAADVKLAMDTIIANDVINSKNGALVSIKSARFITRTVEEIVLP